MDNVQKLNNCIFIQSSQNLLFIYKFSTFLIQMFGLFGWVIMVSEFHGNIFYCQGLVLSSTSAYGRWNSAHKLSHYK
jgi:hypothetical protein